MSQMPLALGGLGAPDFDRFWAGNDHLLLTRLRALADHPGTSQVLLSGAPSSGKTHLLMACCDAARAAGPAALLAAHPTLMKRPVIDRDGVLTLGWTAEVKPLILK